MACSALLAAGCSPGNKARTVVASFYPLAFAAERVAGSGWDVIDLTPPGTEAHDVELSLGDRSAIQDADVVLYLGDIGFQPQVEEAVQEAEGRVVAVWDADSRPSVDATIDPHVWLDPRHFAGMIGRIGTALAREDAAEVIREQLHELDARYRAGLEDCRSRTMVVTHEAFGYLARAYGLEQIGLTGLSPEAEPTVERLGEAGAALADGRATAVFYEADDEARRIAESVAADFGVPALPLGTLESEPPSGDYLSVMEDNLGSLRRGLQCE